jgi:hypothetical protein
MQMKRQFCVRAAITEATFLAIVCASWQPVNGQTSQAASAQTKRDQVGVGKPVGDLSNPGFGNSNAKAMPKGGPPPRTADHHVDFSGVWFAGAMGVDDVTASGSDARRQFDPKVTPEEEPPFQKWAAEKVKHSNDVETELQRPSVNCLPRGVPGMFVVNPYPIQLIQTPEFLAQLNELNNNFRIIPTDGHPHSDDPDPTFNGEGIAHWRGDMLVIDTIGIDERTWNNYVGWFHSDQEHVVERLTRPSKNYLYYQVTIDDPKVLTKPWTSAPRVWTLGHEPLQEYYCTNNHEIEGLQNLRDYKKATGK